MIVNVRFDQETIVFEHSMHSKFLNTPNSKFEVSLTFLKNAFRIVVLNRGQVYPLGDTC